MKEAKKILNGYPTTYQEDLDRLEKDDKEHNLTSNERNCILFIKGEKKILHFLVDAAERILPLL